MYIRCTNTKLNAKPDGWWRITRSSKEYDHKREKKNYPQTDRERCKLCFVIDFPKALLLSHYFSEACVTSMFVNRK